MEIWHRITFNRLDGVDATIKSLNIEYKTNPLPGGGYLIHFDIGESDQRWPRVSALVREKNAPDMFNTVFTREEILNADWIRLMPVFEQGYPQPKEGWEQITYENECSKCGAGYRQKSPFRLEKEPRLGKNNFLCLYWTYTLFCTPKVLEALKTHKISGYEVWEAIIHRTNEPSKIVSQIVIPSVAKPALIDGNKLQPEVCSQCGITKYAYHKRGYMNLRRECILTDVDFQLTFEWFGGGGFREILISNRLAKLILENDWRGVALKPIDLV
jgi:hypothetical protein